MTTLVRSKARFLLLTATLFAVVAGCGRGYTPGYTLYGSRMAANRAYWDELERAFREVNLARNGGSLNQLRVVETVNHRLSLTPIDNIDPELVNLGRSTMNVFGSAGAFLRGANGAPVVLDPTDRAGYLHDDEAALIEQGIATQQILSARYGMEFRPIFNRNQVFNQQPLIVTRTPSVLR